MMKAPPDPIYRTPEDALALVLSIAALPRLELFLRALRARLTSTEPAIDAMAQPKPHP